MEADRIGEESLFCRSLSNPFSLNTMEKTMDDIYFGCICATFNRPTLLPEAIESFLRQSYKNAELIILDDSGTYKEQEGNRWKLYSHPERFTTLGAKHDYSIRNLISSRVNAIAIWDDDDISLPNRLEVLAEGLKKHDIVVPWRLTQMSENGEITIPYGGDFPIHNGAYRLDAYFELGGYSHDADNWEDLELWRRFVGTQKNIGRVRENIYIVRHHHDIRHVSRCASMKEYQEIQGISEEKIDKITPHWEREYDKLVCDYRMPVLEIPGIGRIIDGFTQHGDIRADGTLGYDGSKAIVPEEYRDYSILSTHACSEITLQVRHDIEIRGAVDATMTILREDDPILFAVNADVIGDAAGPWDTTRPLCLPPGEHRLWIDAGNAIHHCHTLWLMKRVEKCMATLENTAFLTVDAFENYMRDTKMFRRSASFHRVPVTYLDEGQAWHGFYEHKIRRMRETLTDLREKGKRYAFITDCRDVIFVDDVQTILAKFNAIHKGKALFNMDVFCQAWPHLAGWYLEELQQTKQHHSPNLNAGLIASDIDTLLEIFDLIEILRLEFRDGPQRKGIMQRLRDETGTGYAENDQILYQLCMAYYPEFFEVDHRKELFALIIADPKTPLRFSDDSRRNDVICNASIIHSPGLSREHRWETWWEEGRWGRSRPLNR